MQGRGVPGPTYLPVRSQVCPLSWARGPGSGRDTDGMGVPRLRSEAGPTEHLSLTELEVQTLSRTR